MTTDIELDDFAERRRQAQSVQEQDSEPQLSAQADNGDGSITAWACGSAALLALISLPLLVFPRFVLFFSVSTEYSETHLTPLEQFLSTHFALFLTAIAVTLVLYIPSNELFETHGGRDSLGHPLLGPLTFTALLSSFISYNTQTVGSLSFLVFIITGIIGLWGLWVILFQSSSRYSKKTGADKHTSAFLFKNRNAASIQKKEWNKAQFDKRS